MMEDESRRNGLGTMHFDARAAGADVDHTITGFFISIWPWRARSAERDGTFFALALQSIAISGAVRNDRSEARRTPLSAPAICRSTRDRPPIRITDQSEEPLNDTA